MKKRIVLIANSVWYVVNFRDNLTRSLKNADYDVVVFAPKDKALRCLNTDFFHIPVNARSMNPFADILLIVRLVFLLRKTKPDVVLNFTIKPVLYGTISARVLGIPCVNNITGLGALFLRGVASRMLGFMLYNIVLRISTIAFFQNPDDFSLFDQLGLLRRAGVDILPGSGVDLRKFVPATRQINDSNGVVVFLYIGRLLAEKGIGDYIDAARIVGEKCKQARFQVIGAFGPSGDEPAIRAKIMLAIQEKAIMYLGTVADVRPHIAKADCVVLPSYREGTPRSLLEAAAMAQPIITTDVPGCREVVDEGANGYLCGVRDPEDLARKMIRFIGLPAGEKARMGSHGRRKMERQFDESIVIGKYLSAIEDLVGR